MKALKYKILIGGLGLFFTLTNAKISQGGSIFDNFRTECTVKESTDGFQGRVSMTLRTAVGLANQSDTKKQLCREKIILDVAKINLKAPITISVKNVTGQYVIEGSDPNTRAALNFDGLDLATSQKWGVVASGLKSWNDVVEGGEPHSKKNCAITFEGTNNIILKNISIKNSALSGICLGKGVTNIRLENVELTHIDGHGIVINEGAKENIITKSVMEDVEGDGIHIVDADLSSHNSVDATDRPLNADQTNTEGTANFVDPVVPANDFIMKAMGGSLVYSNAQAHIKLSVLAEDEPGKFRIEGALVNDDACVPFEITSMDQNRLVPSLERIQVYATGIQVTGETGGQSAIFLTYVGKQSNCSGVDCNYGILEGSDSTNTFNQNGIFKFILDTTSLKNRINQIRTAAGLPEIDKIKEIALVPEMDSLTVGPSREKITLRSGNTRGIVDTCAGEGGNEGGGSSGGVGGGIGFIRIGYPTRNACETQKPRGQTAPRGYDSDSDGLEDRFEDLDGECDCDTAEYSCWDKPDSDGDGISDREEMKGGSIDVNRYNKTTKQFNTLGDFCGTGGAATSDPCDADNNHISNARSDDSDGDGRLDYEEDRARIFVPGRKAHYYIWGGVGNLAPYLDKDSNRVECTDDLINTAKTGVGSKFGVYRVKKDFSGTPREHDFLRSLADDEGLMPLVCRNDSVILETNFNGNLEKAKGETDPYNKKTNSPDYEDGECEGTSFNRATGECELGCIQYEIFQGMDEIYVNDSRTGLAMTTVDGKRIPLVFTLSPSEIATQCSNIDRDNIPDCVEDIVGQCNFNLSENLNPYLKDSDDDGDPDGRLERGKASDICPFNRNNDCDPINSVYGNRKILAYFLDRDGDGLSDGEEDKNQNGNPEKSANPANKETTETDPLDIDSDDDGIDDYTEVVSWGSYTNPASLDTDGDLLPDGLEVKNYEVDSATKLVTSSESPKGKVYVSGNGVGCETFTVIDPAGGIPASDVKANRIGTDPALQDTDADGINDLLEVQGQKAISKKIPIADIKAKLREGFDIASNPFSQDSDNDGLKDGEEYDGIMNFGESNPCDPDTDSDGNIGGDKTEAPACRANDNQNCTAGSGVGGGFEDSDGDGLSNDIEAILGTDPNIKDTDGDGLNDGEEDVVPDGSIQRNQGETEPLIADTDGDGLQDGAERNFQSDPNNPDTDRDGILDGIEIINQTSLDTDPVNPDTDGDGLCDGDRSVNFAGPAGNVSCIRGEDLNINGVVDKDPKNPNQVIETDPRNPDSDSDGENDKDEICHGGSCNIAGNLGRATQGRSEGCFSVSGQHSGDNRAPTSMFYLLGLLLIGNRLMTRQFRKRSALN